MEKNAFSSAFPFLPECSLSWHGELVWGKRNLEVEGGVALMSKEISFALFIYFTFICMVQPRRTEDVLDLSLGAGAGHLRSFT